jgi:hypothetical protein
MPKQLGERGRGRTIVLVAHRGCRPALCLAAQLRNPGPSAEGLSPGTDSAPGRDFSRPIKGAGLSARRRVLIEEMRKGGGIGFLVVLIAAAIVMILTMRAWLSVAPTAQQIMGIKGANGTTAGTGSGAGNPNDPVAKARAAAAQENRHNRGIQGVPDHGQTEVADQERRGVLPDLSDMKQATDQHAEEVKKAAEESNR